MEQRIDQPIMIPGTKLKIERIDKIELYAKDSRVAILRDGTRLPVSRSGYARLRELL